MKNKLLNFYNRSIVYFLSIVGILPACEKGIIPSGGAEYGTPWARYKVSGSVLNKKTNEGINHANILIYRNQLDGDTVYQIPLSDTIKTNENGEFMNELNVFPTSDSLHLKFFDASHPATFATKDTAVWFDADELQGGDDGWYDGETSEEVNVYIEEYE